MLQVIPRLSEILKERNMTQTQLAEKTGIPQGTISKFDKNKQHMDVHLVTISRSLNIPIEKLFYISELHGKATIVSNLNSEEPYRININLDD